MSSLNFSLNDFVTPIAICKAEADLGNVLDVFAQTKANVLAIPMGKDAWGIVKSHNLLAFLAKSWRQNSVAIIGYPKKFYDAESDSLTTSITAFESLIEPAVVYPDSTRFTDFFAPQDNNFFATEGDTYLIADPTGKIRGKLDLKRLLQCLGSKLKNSTVKPYLAQWQDILSNSLDSIAIPFKLETAEGKEIYLNRSWLQLVNQDRDIHLKRSPSDTSIVNWWIEQQLNQSQSEVFSTDHSIASTLKNKARQQHCCLDNRYYLSERLDLSSQATAFDSFDLKQQQANITEYYSESSPITSPDSKSTATPDNIYVQQGKEWNYLKIPIALDAQKLPTNGTHQTTYWLILAIKSSLIRERESANLSLVDDSITVDRLLATISHELKSPLTGIVGLSNLLKSQTIGTLNQRQTQYVRLIYNSGHKLMNVVNDLLELTSLTTGKIDFKPEVIDLESWCAQFHGQVLTRLKSTLAPESRLTAFPKLHSNIEPELTTAICDRSRLLAVVSHLVLEIIKFSADLPAILDIHLKIRCTDNQVAMIVSNSAVELSLQPTSKTESNIESNVNLVIAKYLAKIIGSKIQSVYSSDRCQFTLQIPQPDNFQSKLARNHQINRDNSSSDITILCLYLESEAVGSEVVAREDLNTNLKHWVEQDWSDYDEQKSNNYRHRIIEADGLEQAHTLARIWELDVIVLDGYQIADSDRYLRSLQESEYLSALPLITLDTKTTQAANQIEGLNVYPCLLPAKCRSIKELMQVIWIATGKESNKQ